MLIWKLAIVAFGAFAGTLFRYGCVTWMSKRFPTSFPYGTLTVNIIGCALAGVLWGSRPGEWETLLWGTGFLGGLTTFSTLNTELLALWRSGRRRAFVLYILASYVPGPVAVAAGYILASTIIT